VNAITELAEGDGSLLRLPSIRLAGVATTDDLAAATRQALAEATGFGERQSNRDFE
jgi:hypothetical protein